MSLPNDWLFAVSLVIGAYLVGSIPFAVVFSKLFGLADPRSYGSGNPGATNVLRSGNKAAALLTLVGDAAKGWFAVWFAAGLASDPLTLSCVTLAVFLGHLYPLFLGFKGGKGVATAFGVLAAVQPAMALLTAAACHCQRIPSPPHLHRSGAIFLAGQLTDEPRTLRDGFAAALPPPRKYQSTVAGD